MEQQYVEEEQKKLPSWVSWVSGSALLAAVLVVGLLMNQPSAPVTAPTGYTPYTATDKSFACLAPQGWDVTGGAAQGISSGALFKKGDAKIDISTDLAGSLIGDIAAAADRAASGAETAGGGLVLPDVPGVGKVNIGNRKPPVEKLHDAAKKGMEKRYPNYEEKAMQTVKAGIGEGRYSEFTGGGGFFSPKVHGYRVTFLAADRRVTVLTLCQEKDWATLKPAFEKSITSLSPGGA